MSKRTRVPAALHAELSEYSSLVQALRTSNLLNHLINPILVSSEPRLPEESHPGRRDVEDELNSRVDGSSTTGNEANDLCLLPRNSSSSRHSRGPTLPPASISQIPNTSAGSPHPTSRKRKRKADQMVTKGHQDTWTRWPLPAADVSVSQSSLEGETSALATQTVKVRFSRSTAVSQERGDGLLPPAAPEDNYDQDWEMDEREREEEDNENGQERQKKEQRQDDPDQTSEPQMPSRLNGDTEAPSRQSPSPKSDDRAVSPVSMVSSTSESPLAQRIKMNGSNHGLSAPPALAPVPQPATSEPPKADGAPSTDANALTPTKPSWPPQWLSFAVQAMKVKYPNDKFELSLRRVTDGKSSPEWRIRCRDCPGKLHTPGPGGTLLNYEVHLKNRQHRQRVHERLNSPEKPNSAASRR